MSFFSGTPGQWEQRSTLNPGQQSLQDMLLAALNGQGAGGAFGSIADYFRDLLSNDSQTFDAFAAPEQRRFQEDIIPGLAEQFAGMGSGGLSSSGFRNAGVQAGTDLSERLGAIRAQLRQQGASGLANLGQMGLNPTTENLYTQGKPGLVDFAGPALGVAGAAFGGPAGASLGNAAGNWLSNKFGSKQKQDTSGIYKSIDPRYGSNTQFGGR